MPILGRGWPAGPARIVPAPLISRNPGALAQWTAALSGLNSTPARWLAIGDGPTEGQGASTRANRWIDQTLATIRTAKSSPTGQQFISAAYAVSGDSPWANTGVAYTGSVTAGTASGVGFRVATLTMGGSAAGQFGTSPFGTAPFGGTTGGSTAGSVTFTVTGTSADLWYVAEPTAGNFTYQVDSGTAVAVTSAGTHDIRRISGITLGSNTSHTVTVAVTAGTVYLTGLSVYGADAGTGIHLYDAGRTTATTAAYATGTTDLDDVARMVAPDLVTIQLGYNDIAAGIDPAAHRTNLQTIISAFRALPKVPSIALVIAHYPAALAGGQVTTTAVLPRAGWLATADSQETSGENAPASNVLDDNPFSYWHSHWSGGVMDPLPHNIVLDMRATSTVSALKYLPRPGGGNGTIGQYQVHTSTDGTTWGSAVASGTWTDDATEKTASFTPVAARYVRLTAITEAATRGPFTSAAELNVVGQVTVTTGGWPDYVSVQRLMGVVDPDLGIVDLSLQLPLADTSGSGLYRTDGRHPNDSGHAQWASRVAAFTNVAVTPAGASAGIGRHFLMAVA